MKVQKTKEGKLKIKVRHWSEPKKDDSSEKFGHALRNSGGLKTLEQVSDRKYVDTRPSINKRD